MDGNPSSLKFYKRKTHTSSSFHECGHWRFIHNCATHLLLISCELDPGHPMPRAKGLYCSTLWLEARSRVSWADSGEGCSFLVVRGETSGSITWQSTARQPGSSHLLYIVEFDSVTGPARNSERCPFPSISPDPLRGHFKISHNWALRFDLWLQVAEINGSEVGGHTL